MTYGYHDPAARAAHKIRRLKPNEGGVAALEGWRIDLPSGESWDFSLDEGLFPRRLTGLSGAPPRISLPPGLLGALATLDPGENRPDDPPLRRACQALCGLPLDPEAPDLAALLRHADLDRLSQEDADAMLRAAERRGAEDAASVRSLLPAALTMGEAEREARYRSEERWREALEVLSVRADREPVTLADAEGRKLVAVPYNPGLALIATTRDGPPADDLIFLTNPYKSMGIRLCDVRPNMGGHDASACGHYREALRAFGYPERLEALRKLTGWRYSYLDNADALLSTVPWRPTWRETILKALKDCPDWPRRHAGGYALLDAADVAEDYGHRNGARVMEDVSLPGMSLKALAGAVKRSPKRMKLAQKALGEQRAMQLALMAPRAAHHMKQPGLTEEFLLGATEQALRNALPLWAAEGLAPAGDSCFWSRLVAVPEFARLANLVPSKALDAAVVRAAAGNPEAIRTMLLQWGRPPTDPRLGVVEELLREDADIRRAALEHLQGWQAEAMKRIGVNAEEARAVALRNGDPMLAYSVGLNPAEARRVAIDVTNAGNASVLLRLIEQRRESSNWPDLQPAFDAFPELRGIPRHSDHLTNLPAAFWRRLTPDQCGAVAAARPTDFLTEAPDLDAPRWDAVLTALEEPNARAAAAMAEATASDGDQWLAAIRVASPEAAERAVRIIERHPERFGRMASNRADAYSGRHLAAFLEMLPDEVGEACVAAVPELMLLWRASALPNNLKAAALKADPAAVVLLHRPDADDLDAAARGNPRLGGLLRAANAGHPAAA